MTTGAVRFGEKAKAFLKSTCSSDRDNGPGSGTLGIIVRAPDRLMAWRTAAVRHDRAH